MAQRRRRVTAGELREILEKQGYRCALTGMELAPDTVSFDHLKPIAIGGSQAARNIQAVHRVVNRMKHTLDNAGFVSWCRLVADYSREPADD